MLKSLSDEKIKRLLIECQKSDTVNVLSCVNDGELIAATASTIYNVFLAIEFFVSIGGVERPLYALLPDGNVMLGIISTSPDGNKQGSFYFIVRFKDSSFLN